MWSAGTTRAKVGLPDGWYFCGSPFSAPSERVRPTYVFEGETCRMPASLVSGIEIADAPELNSPRYAMVLSSPTALRAFSDTLPGSHLPVAATESSSDTYLILNLPTLLPAFSSANCSPWTTSSD